MSNDDRGNKPRIEAQPIKPLPMPEYEYQKYPAPSTDPVYGRAENRDDKTLDLSGVSLNFR